MGYFYISAPFLEKSKDATIREIREVVLRKNTADGREITLQRNKFKLANLDTLMFVNDKLLKLENAIESFLKKVDKQYLDLQEKQSHNYLVKDKELPIEKYLYEFRWNDAKYPRNYPIPRLAETLEVKLNNSENDIRQKTNAYNEVRVQLSQSTQKEGNYFVKDLTDVLIEPNVSASDFKYTKFITTLVVIVPVNNEHDFMAEVDFFTSNVVPESAARLRVPEKDGLVLWKVNIFTAKLEEQDEEDMLERDQEQVQRRKDRKNAGPVQEFIERAREKMKLVVKQFKFETGMADNRKRKKEGLEQKLAQQNKILSEKCLTHFSQTYELYAHAKILRLIIETNMRFGSEPSVFYLVNPVQGKEKNVQTMLIDIFGDKENEGMYGTKDQIDDTEDFFPFVYIPMMTLAP